MELSAHGIACFLPAGWSGYIFKPDIAPYHDGTVVELTPDEASLRHTLRCTG